MKKLSLIGFFIISIVLISCSENKKELPSANKPESMIKEADSSSLSWITNVETAVAKAKDENKTVLINFTGSDWCPWCIKLSNEVFVQPEFQAYAKTNLILVKLDFPKTIPQSEATKQYNNDKAQKYGVRGFPTVILLNGDGKVVGNTGYQPGGAANYIEHIKSYK